MNMINDKIEQKIFNGIFGENAAQTTNNNVTQFASDLNGTAVISKDIDVLINDAISFIKSGFGENTTLGKDGSFIPTLGNINALFFALFYVISYIQKEGLNEYHANAVYENGSIVKDTSGLNIYRSKTANNQGNALSDTIYWERIINTAQSKLLYDLLTLTNNTMTVANGTTLQANDIKGQNFYDINGRKAIALNEADNSTVFYGIPNIQGAKTFLQLPNGVSSLAHDVITVDNGVHGDIDYFRTYLSPPNTKAVSLNLTLGLMFQTQNPNGLVNGLGWDYQHYFTKMNSWQFDKHYYIFHITTAISSPLENTYIPFATYTAGLTPNGQNAITAGNSFTIPRTGRWTINIKINTVLVSDGASEHGHYMVISLRKLSGFVSMQSTEARQYARNTNRETSQELNINYTGIFTSGEALGVYLNTNQFTNINNAIQGQATKGSIGGYIALYEH